MSNPLKPVPKLRMFLADLFDFFTIFALGGYLVAKLTGNTVEYGFKLTGAPALLLLAVIIAYFVIGNRFFRSTLWKHILGVAKPAPPSI
jgi:uncharacterized membrane protein YoaK (UPF0700 family)